MNTNENFYPKSPQKAMQKELQIPNFLKQEEIVVPYEEDEVKQISQEINRAAEEGEHDRVNHYHLKELDRQVDNYTEDEVKCVVKRLVSNHPDIVLNEVADLIKDMQELSGIILQNSRMFADKRGGI